MEKFLKLLYYYCLGLFVLFVVYLTTMLAIAPKKDAQMRGFIPCTQKLISEVGNCERGNITCPLKLLWQDTTCNSKVILFGLGAWAKGEQVSPWANYLFEPVVETLMNEEPYDGNINNEMDELKKQRLFMEQKLKELNEAKFREINLNDDVILSNPENDSSEKDAKNIMPENDENIPNPEGDKAIEDEVFIDNIEPDGKDLIQKEPEKIINKNKKLSETELKIEKLKTDNLKALNENNAKNLKENGENNNEK